MGRVLIGDIGGTNARFALADTKRGSTDTPSALMHVKSYRCQNFASPVMAIKKYLEDVDTVAPPLICLAVAGMVLDNTVKFASSGWQFSVRKISAAFGNAEIKLLNDFEAIGYGLSHFDSSDSVNFGLPAKEIPCSGDMKLCVIGPGTGLGCAGLIRRDEQQCIIVVEGGQTGFAPQSSVQVNILQLLSERYGRVSNEHLVSGPGIENLYWSLRRIHGFEPLSLSAQEIFAAGLASQDELALEVVELFFEILGQVAGDLALSLCATEGVYIAGGIVMRYTETLAKSRFRAGFENKGAYREWMEQIPVRLVTRENPGLFGALCATLKS
ncbi:MAG: glucokinase [Pseudomonadales bacterium]|nr:glucokinase [Pseudomonadales bacterium]